MTQATRDRIFSRLMIQPGGCVTWAGAKTNGYGVTSLNGRQVRVHRLMYEMFAGPIPDGLELDHLCHNPACANVSHLEPVTHSENLARRRSYPGWPDTASDYQRSKTNCPNGHPYDMHEGGRRCRSCRREQWRRYNEAKRRG